MMEQRMKDKLNGSETLLWIGKPGSRKLMDSPDKAKIIAEWSVLALFLIFSFGFLVPLFMKEDTSIGRLLAMLIFVNITPVLIAIRPVLDQRKLAKETIYAVTDQRVLALIGNDLLEIPRTDKLACKVVDGNLCFGSAGNVMPKKARERAVIGCKDGNRHLDGILFYQLTNTNKVLEAIA